MRARMEPSEPRIIDAMSDGIATSRMTTAVPRAFPAYIGGSLKTLGTSTPTKAPTDTTRASALENRRASVNFARPLPRSATLIVWPASDAGGDHTGDCCMNSLRATPTRLRTLDRLPHRGSGQLLSGKH